MSEKALQRRLLTVMRGHWVAHKHNDAMPGVPDLSFTIPANSSVRGHGCVVDGWLELKYAPISKRATTVVRFDTRSWAAQKIWMRKRGGAGANIWVLAQVGDVYILLYWRNAVVLLGAVPLADLIGHGGVYWPRFPAAEQLVSALRGDTE